MDPKACWERMRNALYCGDPEEAYCAAWDLSDWLDKGGFLPSVRIGNENKEASRESIYTVLRFVIALWSERKGQ